MDAPAPSSDLDEHAKTSRNVRLKLEPCKCHHHADVEESDEGYDSVDNGGKTESKENSKSKKSKMIEHRNESVGGTSASGVKTRDSGSRSRRQRGVCGCHFRPTATSGATHLDSEGFDDVTATMHIPLMTGQIKANIDLDSMECCNESEICLTDPVAGLFFDKKYKFGMKLRTVLDGGYHRHFTTDVATGGIAHRIFHIRDGDELLCIQSIPVVNQSHEGVCLVFEELLHNLLPGDDAMATKTPTFSFLLVFRRYDAKTGEHVYGKVLGTIRIKERPNDSHSLDSDKREWLDTIRSVIGCESRNGFYWHVTDNNRINVVDGFSDTDEFKFDILWYYNEEHTTRHEVVFRRHCQGRKLFMTFKPDQSPSFTEVETNGDGLPLDVTDDIVVAMHPTRLSPVTSAFHPIALPDDCYVTTCGSQLVTAQLPPDVPVSQDHNALFKCYRV